MQLRKTQALRILDHHQARIRHVHSNLDHGGGNQQVDLCSLKARHHLGFLRWLHAPVH